MCINPSRVPTAIIRCTGSKQAHVASCGIQ